MTERLSARPGEHAGRRAGWVAVYALTLLVACAGVRLVAHEGHGGIAPVTREIELANRRWEVGLGVAPADPEAGETLRIELRAQAITASGMPGRLAKADQLTLTAGTTPLRLQPTSTAGIYSASHVVASEGEVVLRLEVRDPSGARASTDFPVRVRPGPAARLRPLVVAVLVVAVAVLGAILWRPVGRHLFTGGPALRVAGIAIALLLLTATLPASRAVSSAIGGRFAPSREPQAVDWVAEPEDAEGEGGHDAASAGHGTAPASPGPTPEATPGGDPAGLASGRPALDVGGIIARVVVAPDRRADITVPMPGRIVPVEGMRPLVGRHVSKGQTLTTLQPSYIMHDSLHLINLRWPILQSTMDARRAMLQTQITLERLQLALADKAVSTGEVQLAEAAATQARQEYERWSRTLQMHDMQIKDDQPERVPFVSPINGEIAVANFAQGQLVYEGLTLFTIVDITTVWVEALVPEHLSSQFRNRAVVFTAPPYPDETFAGRLQRVAPSVDPVSRTLSHFYSVANPRRLLRIGMSLRVNPAGAGEAGTQ